MLPIKAFLCWREGINMSYFKLTIEKYEVVYILNPSLIKFISIKSYHNLWMKNTSN